MTHTGRWTTPDIGNGTLTQAAAFVMEELGTSWDKIKVEQASPNRDFREGGVYSKVGGILGYFSGRSTGPARMATYMQVAASARERLKAAAGHSQLKLRPRGIAYCHVLADFANSEH